MNTTKKKHRVEISPDTKLRKSKIDFIFCLISRDFYWLVSFCMPSCPWVSPFFLRACTPPDCDPNKKKKKSNGADWLVWTIEKRGSDSPVSRFENTPACVHGCWNIRFQENIMLVRFIPESQNPFNCKWNAQYVRYGLYNYETKTWVLWFLFFFACFYFVLGGGGIGVQMTANKTIVYVYQQQSNDNLNKGTI